MPIEEKLSKAAKMLILTKSKKTVADNIPQWKSAIISAEATAKAKQDTKERSYIISYRISSEREGVASSASRRSSLVELITCMPVGEHHTSTSTYIVEFYLERASEIIGLLSGPLERTLDFISVSRVSSTNRAKLGNADLQS